MGIEIPKLMKLKFVLFTDGFREQCRKMDFKVTSAMSMDF